MTKPATRVRRPLTSNGAAAATNSRQSPRNRRMSPRLPFKPGMVLPQRREHAAPARCERRVDVAARRVHAAAARLDAEVLDDAQASRGDLVADMRAHQLTVAGIEREL